MRYDNDRLALGLRGAYDALYAKRTSDEAGTHNRVSASLKFVVDGLRPGMPASDIFKLWSTVYIGSSTCMIANWLEEVGKDEPNEFALAAASAQNILMTRYHEPPKQLGLCWAFTTAAAVADGLRKRRDNVAVFRRTARILSVSGNTDRGVRAFALFLKGFAAKY